LLLPLLLWQLLQPPLLPFDSCSAAMVAAWAALWAVWRALCDGRYCAKVAALDEDVNADDDVADDDDPCQPLTLSSLSSPSSSMAASLAAVTAAATLAALAPPVGRSRSCAAPTAATSVCSVLSAPRRPLTCPGNLCLFFFAKVTCRASKMLHSVCCLLKRERKGVSECEISKSLRIMRCIIYSSSVLLTYAISCMCCDNMLMSHGIYHLFPSTRHLILGKSQVQQ